MSLRTFLHRNSQVKASKPKRIHKRRCSFERMEDRLVLTTGLELDGFVSAGGDEAVFPNNAISDAAGNTYMAGYFYGTVDFDLSAAHPGGADFATSRGPIDGFVAKYGPSQELEWVRRVGGDSSDRVESVDLDAAGHVYIAGGFSENADIGPSSYQSEGRNDGFVAKLDPAGNFEWVQTWGGPESSSVDEMTVDASGTATIIGIVRPNSSSELPQEIGTDIRQYDSAGNLNWAHLLVNDTIGQTDIARTPTGDFMATGEFRGTVDLDPGADEYLVSGPENKRNVFVLGLSDTGAFQWGSSLVADTATTSASDASMPSVAVSNDGSVAVVTRVRGTVVVDPNEAGQVLDVGDDNRRIFVKYDA